jgi:hypothetical protein
MPQYFIDDDSTDFEINDSIEFSFHKTTKFNICCFLKIPGIYNQIHLKYKKQFKCDVQIKLIETPEVYLQSVIVMKNEHHLIPDHIKYHSFVDRFIIFECLYKNESCTIEHFDVPYLVHDDRQKKCGFYIIAQNTAYSIAMKKYNAVWSMLFDLDEFLKIDKNIFNSYLAYDALGFSGFWAGCNSLSTFNPYKITKRSNTHCQNKWILKNDKNNFTKDIHWVVTKNYLLLPHKFLHMYHLSNKKRKCQCDIYCIQPIFDKKIACFGASVTQQKNGYAHQLKNFFECVDIYGYGAEHIFPGAIIHLDTVLQNKPDILFIDWFSTGYTNQNENTLAALHTLLLKANCYLIFLFLPREDHSSRISFYSYLKNILRQYNIAFIDIAEQFEYNTEIIKDSVHTTDYGGKLYSEFIFQKLHEIFFTLQIPQKHPQMSTKYINIQKLSIQQTFFEKFVFRGNGTIVSCAMKIGPFSGYVSYKKEEILLWDTYCHYTRNYSNINNIEIKESVQFNILQKQIDYSKCRRPEFDFSKFKKKVILLDIYFLGNITLDAKNSL